MTQKMNLQIVCEHGTPEASISQHVTTLASLSLIHDAGRRSYVNIGEGDAAQIICGLRVSHK
jgi:hypothetical protein